MLRVDGVIKAADVRGREFTGEIGKRGAELRKLRERGLADNRNRIVWRKIVAGLRPSHPNQTNDKSARGNSPHGIHFVFSRGAVEEGQAPSLWRASAKAGVYI